jgi:hypothetical protein
MVVEPHASQPTTSQREDLNQGTGHTCLGFYF